MIHLLLLIDVRFSQPIEAGFHFVSLGTMEFEFSCGTISFDFECSIGEIDDFDPRVIHFKLMRLDRVSFPASEVLLERDVWLGFSGIKSIDIDVGEFDLDLVSVPRISVYNSGWSSSVDISLSVLSDFEVSLVKKVV